MKMADMTVADALMPTEAPEAFDQPEEFEAPGEPVDEFPHDFAVQMSKAADVARPLGWEWGAALRFLAGEQNLSITAGLPSYSTSRSVGSNNYNVNMIYPHFRAKVAQLDLHMPSCGVRPATATSEDIRKAAATEQAADYIWDTNRLERHVKHAIHMCIELGTSALHTYFSKESGKFQTCAKSSYDIRFEAGAVNDDEWNWVAIRNLWKKDALVAIYPDAADVPEASTTGSQPQDNRRPNAIQNIDRIPEDSVEVWDVYFKDGRHGLWSDTKWLWKGRTPDNIVPVQIMRYDKLSDRVYGRGLVVQLMALQQVLNRLISRSTDMLEAMANPVWLNPNTSGVSKGQLTNTIGGVINYNAAGGKPERERGLDVPMTVYEQIKLVMSLMQDVASQHSQSMGKRAVGVNSGVAINELADTDLQQMTSTMETIAQCVQDLVITNLIFAKHTWTQPVMTKAFGLSGGVEYKAIQGTDLMDMPDVIVEASTLFSRHVEDMEKRLQGWVQMGAITAQDAFKMSSLRSYNADKQQAMMRSFKAASIVEMIKQQLPVEIFPTDPIQQVAEQLDEYMDSTEYYQPYLDALQAQDPAAITREAQKMNYIRAMYGALVAPPGVDGNAIQANAATPVAPRPAAPAGAPQMPLTPNPPGNPMPQQGPMPQEQVDQRAETTESRGGQLLNRSGRSFGAA